MLVLLETSAGYSLFKSTSSSILKCSPPDIATEYFSSSATASKAFKLKAFGNFTDTAEAVSAATGMINGEASKGLLKFLKKNVKDGEDLAVMDKSLGLSIKTALDIKCVDDSVTHEIFRGLREFAGEMMKDEVSEGDMRHMQLGLSHSLSRYKLKFSPDKVDTMIIQAIGLLDELDREINTYAMRVKEWYGWHFPELAKILNDNTAYARTVLAAGYRTNIKDTDLSAILEDENIERLVKESAEISMGTEIADIDVVNIKSLAEQVVNMSEYRAQLYEYLKNRMATIAPNLSILVGDLVGARLISHAGSLMNLAKHPASTVQILGAEKALFRALKTKHDTPKYGLIYHASLIGQASAKNKGKISRVLAAKCALGIRVDALSDDVVDTTMGYESRAKVEARIRQLEGGVAPVLKGDGGVKKTATLTLAAKTGGYSEGGDMVEVEGKKSEKKEKKAKKEKKEEKKVVEEAKVEKEEKVEKKRSASDAGGEKKSAKKAKKEKKEKKSKD